MLGNITNDRRAQALLLAWGFGGFIEGVAGYGIAAVAIPAAIMVSLDYSNESSNHLFDCKYNTNSIWNSRLTSNNNIKYDEFRS